MSATVENSFVEFLNNVNEKNSADENKKPKFSTEMVNEVIKDTHKMSGWQQIKRIYQTYMQHDYKNASEHDTYPLPPFEYFIPFEDLKKRPVESKTDVDDEYKSYDAMVDERALRFDLHRFIFICEPK